MRAREKERREVYLKMEDLLDMKNSRQIKLWGLENDKKIRCAHVLVVIDRRMSCDGCMTTPTTTLTILIELLKNMILLGIVNISIWESYYDYTATATASSTANATNISRNPIFGDTLADVINTMKILKDYDDRDGKSNVNFRLYNDKDIVDVIDILDNLSVCVFIPSTLKSIANFIQTKIFGKNLHCPLVISNIDTIHKSSLSHYYYKKYDKYTRMVLDSHSPYYNVLFNLRISLENPALCEIFNKYHSTIQANLEAETLPYPLVLYNCLLSNDYKWKDYCSDYVFLIERDTETFPKFWNKRLNTARNRDRIMVEKLHDFYNINKRLPLSDSSELFNTIKQSILKEELIKEYEKQFMKDCRFFILQDDHTDLKYVENFIRNMHLIDLIESNDNKNNIDINDYVQYYNDNRDDHVHTPFTTIRCNILGGILSQEITKIITENFIPL